jgi:23S rRNA pseudouridine1911/1915/1917 synthase
MGLRVCADFRVIDESDDWIVVDKPAPLIVHPANGKPEPTLLGGVCRLLAFEIANGARPAVVNRLDRDTSGVVVVAKHPAAARELGGMFERREVSKEYTAVVRGWPDRDEWGCDLPLLRAGAEHAPRDFPAIWVRQIPHPAGRPCSTRFRVLRRFERGENRFAVIRCVPVTGRMHQIRVHLAASGFPVVGDKVYDGDGTAYVEWMADRWTPEWSRRMLLPRHALHASSLSLSWQGIGRCWTSPLPADLASLANPRGLSFGVAAGSVSHG